MSTVLDLTYEKLTEGMDEQALEEMNSAEKAYAILKHGILKGHFPVNQPIAQAQLARVCRVSRTPLREATRKLEQELFISSEKNKRLLIPSLSAEEIDQLVATRIIVQAAAVMISFSQITQEDIRVMGEKLSIMDKALAAGNIPEVRAQHKSFHRQITRYANQYLRYQLTYLEEQSNRYREIYIKNYPLDIESHYKILQACKEKDLKALLVVLSQHTGQMGLMTLAAVDSLYEPVEIRRVLQLIIHDVSVQ